MLAGNDVVVYDQDPENLFEILEQLGKGNYGSVFKGRNKQDNRNVAIKIIPIMNDIDSINKEIAILKQCQCPYIVNFNGAYLKGQDLWLILEFCNAGSV